MALQAIYVCVRTCRVALPSIMVIDSLESLTGYAVNNVG